jgi:hypothetical protein
MTAPKNNQPAAEPKPKRKARKELVEAGDRGLTFKNLDSMYRFCVAVAASKEFRDIETPEQALMRLQAGLELGLSPIWSITNIMVVNGRPSVWGDALLGLVLRHPDCEDVIETIENQGTEDETAVCEVRRKGRVPVIRKFSIADVRRAGLDRKMQSVHGSYPARMRQMRARSWACRDAFADTLRGLAVVEEVRDNGISSSSRAEEKKATGLILPDEVSPKSSSAQPAPKVGEEPSAQEISPVPVLAKVVERGDTPSESGGARESTNEVVSPKKDSRGGGKQSENAPEEEDELPF